MTNSQATVDLKNCKTENPSCIYLLDGDLAQCLGSDKRQNMSPNIINYISEWNYGKPSLETPHSWQNKLNDHLFCVFCEE